jgi:FHA domain
MIDQLQLVPAPGDGVLGRFSGLVVLALPEFPDDPRVRLLLDICRDVTQSVPPPAEALLRRLAAQFGSGQGLPAFGVVADASAGVVVVAHGQVDMAVVAGGREVMVSGRHSLSWVERLIDQDPSVVRGGPSLELPDEALLRHGPGMSEGVVPAGGFVLVPRSESVDPPRPPLAIDSSAEFRSVLLTEVRPEKGRPPLPLATEVTTASVAAPTDAVIVKGVECSRGHFTDPDNFYCAVCGISMAQRTRVLVDGVRPPLGFLVFDDGMIYALDGDYVVGREPYHDARLEQGARPLPLDDAAHTVSRVHAEVRLDGWHVHIVDRDSTNGTFIWDDAASLWRRLDASDRERVRAGAKIAFGHRTCVFESPHGQHR